MITGSLMQDESRKGDDLPGGEMSDDTGQKGEEMSTGSDMEALFAEIRPAAGYKKRGDHNPVMIQRFGADPYSMIYGDRVYLYMTGDDHMLEPDGSIKENNYANIDKIHVLSSDDLVNWTDHGTVYAAGKNGAAVWGNNSWAPAAAWKTIDGKDRFFLYFANSGNGIAVLSSDSPTGPFTDPIGGPLVSRDTPTCAEVTWLFDPAVLMDEDGKAYIYFGGGIPSPDRASDPGTARMARLADDMIHLDGDPVPIEQVAYLFEDSGINKIGGRYYYSYCSNFNVTDEAKKEFGFDSGEIVTMVGDDPLGPFTLWKGVLKNPGFFFGNGGNNHHCIFNFHDQWYIAYHARLLEKAMDSLHGYRSTNIDLLALDENGAPAASKGTTKGVKQIRYQDPYKQTPAVTIGNAAGITTRQFGEEAEKYGSGDMILTGISDGSWICVHGEDFGTAEAAEFLVSVQGSGSGAIRVSLDAPDGPVVAFLPVDAPGNRLTEISSTVLVKPSGVHDLYLTFAGSGYELYSWRFANRSGKV
ncbi:MAG: family 43 glycosylhydrolase [Lachnospiraceae bacterium]|nr:family 43 glycosylhydrolase [Lachnospiraceae bacterium]